MTKIAISPNVNGTGTFTLAAPDSNTDRTLTLPDAGGSVVLNEGSGTFKIDSSGNVGVGTSSPTTKLEVEGDGFFKSGHLFVGNTAETFPGLINTNTGLMAETAPGGVTLFVSRGDNTPLRLNTNGDRQLQIFTRSASEVGSISVTTTATSYNTSSDYRLKEDVQPMSGASDRVLALKPCNFAWKVNGTRVDGFLAHEAQAVVPEAVHGLKDEVDADGSPVYQGIDQSKLVPLLTAALQEALADIATLKAEVAALKGASA